MARLRVLRVDAAAGRTPQDFGQFSLAGAQPKTALLFDGQRWGVPAGRTPTTRILKPTTPDLDGHAENEHLCLSLARALGMPTAQSEVKRFEEVTAIVVTRYDRVDTKQLAASAAARAASAAAEAASTGDPFRAARAARTAVAATADSEVMASFSKSTPIFRVHQEDLCQAVGVHPSKKYQNDGGPGPRQIIGLLRANVRGTGGDAVEEDTATFLGALVFNWLIGGNDAHAKNYALLFGSGGLVRLGPLYDVANIFAYGHIDPLKVKLSVKIGKIYRLQEIGWNDWQAFAHSVGLPADAVIEKARAMVSDLPDALSDEIARMRAAGIDHPVLNRLANALVERARSIQRL